MHKNLVKRSSNVCKRRVKVDGQYRQIIVRQPQLVQDYNMNMCGVDKSDQLIGKYKTLRPTKKYWKTLFYHFLDIGRVNSYILMQDWRLKNPGNARATKEEVLQPIGFFNRVNKTVKWHRKGAHCAIIHCARCISFT